MWSVLVLGEVFGVVCGGFRGVLGWFVVVSGNSMVPYFTKKMQMEKQTVKTLIRLLL